MNNKQNPLINGVFRNIGTNTRNGCPRHGCCIAGPSNVKYDAAPLSVINSISMEILLRTTINHTILNYPNSGKTKKQNAF